MSVVLPAIWSGISENPGWSSANSRLSEQGSALAEALVAVSILAVTAAALFSTWNVSGTLSRRSWERTHATRLMQSSIRNLESGRVLAAPGLYLFSARVSADGRLVAAGSSSAAEYQAECIVAVDGTVDCTASVIRFGRSQPVVSVRHTLKQPPS